MRNWMGKTRVELPKSKGTQNWTFGICIAVSETALQFSFNYNWIFALSLAFNLINLKSRGYPDVELGGKEKSRTIQEQGNSKLDFWKLHCQKQSTLPTCLE
ncbi:unnamed protein product [Prunus armeniaca]